MLNIDVSYCWEQAKSQENTTFSAQYQTQIPTGFTALIGGSGEGKSTLLHLLGGFIKGKGIIQYLGENISNLSPDKRPLTTLFQSDNLFPQLTVWQNVAIGLANTMKLNSEENDAVEWALERTKLLDYRNKMPDSLSGGQAQRVALARAIARATTTKQGKKRPILLLDEPFSALDPSLRMNMLQLVSELTEQLSLTTLLVSHLPEEIKHINGQLLLIEGGRIVLQDDIAALSKSVYPQALQNYLS